MPLGMDFLSLSLYFNIAHIFVLAHEFFWERDIMIKWME
jgi:hypothetical protein